MSQMKIAQKISYFFMQQTRFQVPDFIRKPLRISYGPPILKIQPPCWNLNVVVGLAAGSQGLAAIMVLGATAGH